MLVYPDYYPQFSCIADKCRHSCCIGWEIDIDGDAARRYRAMGGELGARLRKAMSDTDPAHFILTADGRCPMLRGDGLCELILGAGEDALCEICTMHPRYINEWDDRTETGLGLCCEEAARLVLEHDAPIRLISDGEYTENPETAERDAVISALENRNIPLIERIKAVLPDELEAVMSRSVTEWRDIFLSLERLDDAWTDVLGTLTDDAPEYIRCAEKIENRYENLLVTFIYRHYYDYGEDAYAFALLSTYIIFVLDAASGFELDDQIEHVRAYSSEIEYSDENIDALMDVLFGAAP